MATGNALVGNYTYGVDGKGLLYIYDMNAHKMLYYGDKSKGIAQVYGLQANGGKIKYEGDQAANAAANAPAQTPSYNGQVQGVSTVAGSGSGYSSSGSTYTPPPKVLDQAQLDSLDSLINSFGTIRDQAKQKAALKRDASTKEKQHEMQVEKGKYDGKKLSTLQDFAGATNDTTINTRDTIENLMSSLSTMGLAGGRALSRQITDAANMANRKANQTQATNNQSLDSAFNEYSAGNANDLAKINDQYGYDAGEADRKFYQDKQNALYKKADVYNAVDDTTNRQNLMNQGNDLNSLISSSSFLNPSYTGETKAMATPDLANYTQDIAKYGTADIGAAPGAPTGAVTPVTVGAATPGNMAIKAIALNDKDLGVKTKQANGLGYGV